MTRFWTVPDAVQELARRRRGLPWLVLGKGPSLEKHDRVRLDWYQTFGLNHVCQHLPVAIAHFTDLEAFHDCADSLKFRERHGPVVILPWVPHEKQAPGRRDLADLMADARERALAFLADAGRLWSYNSTRAKVRHPELTTVRVRQFSAVAAFNLLAAAGVRTIYTLGVDGGTQYASFFDPKDCLRNGQPSFDSQFREIQETVKRYQLRWINLADIFREEAHERNDPHLHRDRAQDGNCPQSPGA